MIIAIQPPTVHSIAMHPDRTYFYSVERGFLRFADVELTPEELNKLHRQVIGSMTLVMLRDLMDDARAAAQTAVQNLVTTLMSAVDANDTIKVTWKE
ncbi:MAG: DUF4230 domain-containing protein [Defluviitaleaceae bacterium]|nr:DUF4230 domain-containing protein [Defluviitaleaceae bacterium]